MNTRPIRAVGVSLPAIQHVLHSDRDWRDGVEDGMVLYDGSVRCPVRIVETDHMTVIGDDEEPQEQPGTGTWFRIDLGRAGEPTHWVSSIEGFTSLDEAIAHYAGMTIAWDD